MIILTQTTVYHVDLSDRELSDLLDRYGCPPAEAGQTPEERFMDSDWTPSYEADMELMGLGEVNDEDIEYDID